MVGGEDDERLFKEPVFFQQFEQASDALIHPGHGLVVLSEFFAGLEGVRQKGWDDDVCRVVENLVYTGVRAALGQIAKEVGGEGIPGGVVAGAASMRIMSREIQKEGTVVVSSEELGAGLGHGDIVAAGKRFRDHFVEAIDGFRRDVVFADPGGAISHPAQAVGMIVGAGQNNGSAGAAAGGGGIGVGEQRAFLGQFIECWSSRDRVAVCAERLALVVGDDEQDVAFGSGV